MLNFYFSPKEKTTAFYLSTFKSEKVLYGQKDTYRISTKTYCID